MAPTPSQLQQLQERMSPACARMLARSLYFWAWPMVNVLNRRRVAAQVRSTLRLGSLIVAPLNRLGMLTDYVSPEQTSVACPNQDVVYGSGTAALDLSPVVLQVPDFGGRYWLYQVADLRTEGVAELGTLYGTEPGHYLIVGPDWDGEVPAGIRRVFRSSSRTALVYPRIQMDNTPADRAAIQGALAQIAMYPLDEFDGRLQVTDWLAFPQVALKAQREGERAWVSPERFLDDLAAVFEDAPPRPGEAALHAQALALMAAARHDPRIHAAVVEEAQATERELIAPLLQFRNFGLALPHHWSTIRNGADFGHDYLTRTAVARSNMFVNRLRETAYHYQDLDAQGERLDGRHRYTVRFEAGQTPPVAGFWSLTLYNEHHFFAANPIGRYSLGTKDRDLHFAADGSLTIHVQANEPEAPAARANWLPAPQRGAFSLYVRAYSPLDIGEDAAWTPPPVVRIEGP